MPLKINQELLLTSENEDAGEEGGNRGYMYINKHTYVDSALHAPIEYVHVHVNRMIVQN